MKKDLIIFGAGLLFFLASSLATFYFYHDLTNKRYELSQLIQDYRELCLEYNRLTAHYETFEREIAELHIQKSMEASSRARYYFLVTPSRKEKGNNGFPAVARRLTSIPR